MSVKLNVLDSASIDSIGDYLEKVDEDALSSSWMLNSVLSSGWEGPMAESFEFSSFEESKVEGLPLEIA